MFTLKCHKFYFILENGGWSAKSNICKETIFCISLINTSICNILLYHRDHKDLKVHLDQMEMLDHLDLVVSLESLDLQAKEERMDNLGLLDSLVPVEGLV